MMARFCVAAASVASVAGLQTIINVEALPDVKGMMAQPMSMYEEVRAGTGSFEDQLMRVQRANEASTTVLKAELEVNLTEQMNRTHDVESQNSDMMHEISSLRKDNSKLRDEAATFDKKNAALLRDLQFLQANMSTAQEFVNDALNSSVELLDTSPELAVLDQLEKTEQEEEVEQARSMRLKEVKSAVLLEVGKARKPAKSKKAVARPISVDVGDLVQFMHDAMRELAETQEQSEQDLKDQAAQMYAKEEDHIASLLVKQEELDSTKADVLALNQRLADAVGHLSNTHNLLQERSGSIRFYAGHLGGNSGGDSGGDSVVAPLDATSLLQVASRKLPGIQTVLEKPDTVYKSMTTHVSSLAEQLEAVNAQGVDEVEQEKKDFDEQIKKLQKNNTHQIHENEKVVRDIKLLDMAIASLRSKSALLMEQNKDIREDMRGVQDKITLVQEFLVTSLDTTDENSSNTDDLKVLGELASEDAAKKQELMHKKSLDIITKKQEKKTVATKTLKTVKKSKSSKISLLQVGSVKKHGDIKKDKKDKPDGKGASAQELMATLASNLEQLMAEQAEGQATLKAQFEEESSNLTSTHEELLEEWNTLNATRTAKTEAESRLKVAVAHLEKVRKSLGKRHVSLLNFGKKLATRPNPLAAHHPGNLMETADAATVNMTDANSPQLQPLAWASGLFKQLR